MRYMLNIWDANEKQFGKNTELIPILPIIVYHGKNKWHYKQFYEHFKNIPSELIPYIPSFKYFINDLQSASHNEIMKVYHSIILQTSFLVMKDIFNIFALLANIKKIFTNLYSIDSAEFDKRFKTALFYYLFSANTESNFIKITNEVRQLPKTDKDMISMADVLISKGIQKDRKEGIQKGIERTACVMLLEEFDLDIIQRSTKLEMKRILELQSLVKEKGASILDNFDYE